MQAYRRIDVIIETVMNEIWLTSNIPVGWYFEIELKSKCKKLDAANLLEPQAPYIAYLQVRNPV